MEVSFGSTYRIPFSQAGVNKPQKAKLREFVGTFYENNLMTRRNGGYCRVSMPQEKDADFEDSLKQMGFRAWQKFDAHNLKPSELDSYIFAALDKNGTAIKGQTSL